MRISALETIKQHAGKQLLLARDQYERILRLCNEDAALIRIAPLFHSDGLSAEALRPAPYQLFMPHVLVSFDPSKGFGCEISQDASSIAPNTAHRDLVITLDQRGPTPWFAVEVQAPWAELRPASTISITLCASGSSKGEVSIKLFCYDTKGVRHELLTSSSTDTIDVDVKCLRLDGHIELPSDVAIDFGRDPELAVFLDPTIEKIRIADWAISLE